MTELDELVARIHTLIDRAIPPKPPATPSTLPSAARTTQLAPATPDGWAPYRCDECAATWTGQPGEPCGWCHRRLEAQLERADRNRRR